ncbi:hypothetical protein DOFOFD_11995 [Acetobacteraceae bacterium EV16P]|uniref:NAD-dependent epimerase/dehydratase domain-containing protein n=1 Tax=Sorlinia euscelidii TaxID=3081148 RepID=A0ABU7U4E1_9PROT
MPSFVTNTTNNYGYWHFPEKLIPLVTINAIEGRPLPVYGEGSNVRDWLFVDDHAEALVRAVERGVPGETYAIGARQPRSNLEVVRAICNVLDEISPDPKGKRDRLISFVKDVRDMISAMKLTRAMRKTPSTGRRNMISKRGSG